MAPPMGTWNINANGTQGILILSTSPTGGITGSAFGDPITAVWDETSQILSFSRATQGAPASFVFDVYIGTLFQPYDTPNGLVSGEGVPLMLAGNFGTATVGGSVGPFDKLGWFATSQTKFKEKEGKEGKDLKDHKDGKEHKDKEGKEKELHEKPPHGQELSPRTDLVSPMLMDSGLAPDVRFATGKSFVSAEERPPVGAAALQVSNQNG